MAAPFKEKRTKKTYTIHFVSGAKTNAWNTKVKDTIMSGLCVLIQLIPFLAQRQAPYISGSQMQVIFDCPSWGGEEDTVIQHVEARDGAKPPTMDRTAPTNRISTVQGVSAARGAKMEKLHVLTANSFTVPSLQCLLSPWNQILLSLQSLLQLHLSQFPP